MFISPLSEPGILEGIQSPAPFSFKPPYWFKPLIGKPRNARFAGPVSLPKGRTAAQRAGLRYEDKVLSALELEFGSALRRAPVIEFFDASGPRRIIPDAFVYLNGMLVILEVKISHRDGAWWQLRRLYEPVVRLLTDPGVSIAICEICRTSDFTIPYPEPCAQLTKLAEVTVDKMGVVTWKL